MVRKAVINKNGEILCVSEGSLNLKFVPLSEAKYDEVFCYWKEKNLDSLIDYIEYFSVPNQSLEDLESCILMDIILVDEDKGDFFLE